MMLSLMLATAITQAIPSNHPGSWLGEADYPKGAKQRREEGPVSYAIIVGPDGRGVQCFVTASSGFPELDHQTCVAVLARAKFKPATDEKGESVYDRYNATIFWRHPDRQSLYNPVIPPVAEADMELKVQKLPDGKQEETVSIVAKIDPSGHIVFCEPSRINKGPTELAEIACAQAKANYAFIQTDADGKPVTLIRSLRVTFKVTPQ